MPDEHGGDVINVADGARGVHVEAILLDFPEHALRLTQLEELHAVLVGEDLLSKSLGRELVE